MAFRNGSYATVWDVKPKGDLCQVELSTSRKNKETGQYVTDFADKFVLFCGEAGKKAQDLNPKDRIQIKECSVCNTYDKERKIKFWNSYVYDFDILSSRHNDDAAPANNTNDNDDDMPF